MVPIDSHDFSLYDLIDWHNVSSIFTERRSLLAHWSATIEKTVIERRLAADVVAGFQSLDRITPILPRYQQLATVAHSLTVFGTPSNSNLSGLKICALHPGDRLVQEWFLIVRHPDYNRALIARELDHEPRCFHGILTSDPAQVERFQAVLTQLQRA
ncbi:MAG: hypothetical protein GC204_05035 [Chloroflexi bacterium]|nr:hypothetical protein [Chloroflexota bacterium]